MIAYVFDAAIVLILIFFAWRGAKKGLILTLCGLLGLFVAFFGAHFLSNQFYAPIANIVEPGIYQTIRGAEPEEEQTETNQPSIPGSLAQEPDPTYSLDELLDSIGQAGVLQGLAFFLDQSRQEESIPQEGGLTVARALAHYLSQLVAKAILFAIAFIGILLVWFLVSHILDLAFHLPILAAVNTVGGLVAGLLKAVLMIFVLVWLGQLAGWIPAQPTTPILSLFSPKGLGSLLDQWLI